MALKLTWEAYRVSFGMLSALTWRDIVVYTGASIIVPSTGHLRAAG